MSAPALLPRRRARRNFQPRIAIVGAGFGGLGMAIRLQEAGYRDVRIFEQSDGVGGTWRANTYPGAACDVQSHLYSFSFEPYPHWSSMFGKQPEILAYLEHCADKYGLRDRIVCHARVAGATFDEARGRWTIELSDGRTYTADVVVSAVGPLSRPLLPAIPGRDKFRGPAFHSAQWDHQIDLRGKRVAVIGTGASAIQIVPQVQALASELHVYQRTPAWILPKPDRQIGARERRLYAAVPPLQRAYRYALYWLYEMGVMGLSVHPPLLKPFERLALKHLREQVPDPELRRRLTPTYDLGCKRVLLANDYYPAMAQPNVELIDESIAKIVPTGIVTVDGRRRPVDAIVYCTGFDVTGEYIPFPVVGRGGRVLNEVWKQEGAAAYLGTTVAGFPNMFTLVGPNTGLGHNSIVFIIEAQINYVMDALRQLNRRGARTMDVRPEVQERYNAWVQRRLQGTVWMSGCQSWYLDEQGRNTTLWPGPTSEFWARTRQLRPRDYAWAD